MKNNYCDIDRIYNAARILKILKMGYCSTTYNPKGDYHHITFDVYCEEDYKIIDEWLKDVKKVIIYE